MSPERINLIEIWKNDPSLAVKLTDSVDDFQPTDFDFTHFLKQKTHNGYLSNNYKMDIIIQTKSGKYDVRIQQTIKPGKRGIHRVVGCADVQFLYSGTYTFVDDIEIRTLMQNNQFKYQEYTSVDLDDSCNIIYPLLFGSVSYDDIVKIILNL